MRVRQECTTGISSVFLTVSPGPTGHIGISEEQEELQKMPAEEPKYIYVFLCGAVQQPGVYALTENSRLFEALEQAGGFLPEADTEYHNLARLLKDGERIYILSKDESAQMSIQEQITGEPEEQELEPGTTNDIGEKQININTATVAELTSLPGIGEARAKDIVEYRTKVGEFREITELMNVSGIGEAMFEKIKHRITIK